MNILHSHILAYLFARPGRAASFTDTFSVLTTEGGFGGNGEAFSTELATMAKAGLLAYDKEASTVTALADPATFATEEDADVPKEVNDGLQALADAFGAESVQSFLASVRARGLDTPDAVVAVRTVVRVALISAAKLTDERLRGPLFRGARIVDAFRVLLANPT